MAGSEKPDQIRLSGIVEGSSVVQAGSVRDITINKGSRDHPVPSQLPPPPQSFTSRDSELARLDQWLAESSGLVVAVISGAGGVGKTTLALEWLHRVRKRFPNGMLHADLGTFSSSGPAAPDHVLEFFLLALGTRAVDMPPDLPQRQALYRSMTADRAMIVLLDDAVSAAQVRPLLPAYGNTVVVVTSRRRLAGLSLDSARFLELGPLSVADSVQLMDNIVGAGRLAREQSQAEEIARLCGGMPLALSLVGARLSARPHRPVSREVGTLRSDDRLATLTVDESSVEAVFDVSYGELASSPARTYRMCSLHPGRQFSLDAAAAATGEEPDEVEESLSELVDCHLIAEISDRRFRYHDLLRLHARQQARWVDPRADREAAVRRMADWYLDRSAAADLALRPTRRRVGSRFQVPLEHPFPSHSDALRWLAVERHNLLDAVRAAAQHGWDEATWEFCEALWGFFLHARHYDDWLEMHKLGIPAAQRTGNTVAEARLRTQLVLALAQLHRYDEALDEGAIALRLAKQAQDEFTEAALLFEVAGVFLSQGDLDAALRHFKQAEQLRLKIGTERAVALCRRRIGETLVKLGRHDEALTTLLDVASTFAEIDRAEHARVLTILGSLYLDLDRVPDAASSLAEALRIARELGSDQYEAEALVVLGDAALRQGDVESARRHWTLARDHYSGNRDPKAAEMSVRLSSIPLPRNKDS